MAGAGAHPWLAAPLLEQPGDDQRTQSARHRDEDGLVSGLQRRSKRRRVLGEHRLVELLQSRHCGVAHGLIWVRKPAHDRRRVLRQTLWLEGAQHLDPSALDGCTRSAALKAVLHHQPSVLHG